MAFNHAEFVDWLTSDRKFNPEKINIFFKKRRRRKIKSIVYVAPMVLSLRNALENL
jgi:hypothetical protein